MPQIVSAVILALQNVGAIVATIGALVAGAVAVMEAIDLVLDHIRQIGGKDRK